MKLAELCGFSRRTKARPVPSGDHVVPPYKRSRCPLVSRRGLRPSASMIQICPWRTKARRFPSGDQAGRSPVARRFSPVPSALTTRISGLLSPEEKAIVVPAGDQTGSEAPGAFFADNLRLPCPLTPTRKMAGHSWEWCALRRRRRPRTARSSQPAARRETRLRGWVRSGALSLCSSCADGLPRWRRPCRALAAGDRCSRCENGRSEAVLEGREANTARGCRGRARVVYRRRPDPRSSPRRRS
jgi:hypothetical protein